MKIILALLGLIAVANASCPGASPCSGHGSCDAHDKCTCNRDFSGIDCNYRNCPKTISWGSESGHVYEECGGKGTCDSKTGICKCFDGFEGRGCTRMKCPNDCNGRGTCEPLSKFGATTWDADKIQICNCDADFTGPSCESRICPRGNDPLTAYDSSNVAEVDETVTFAWDKSSVEAGGQFLLKYTTHTGQVLYTHPISSEDATAITIEEALENVPNSAIIDVTCTDNGSATTIEVDCVFSHPLMGGKQSDSITKDVSACQVNGCQPVRKGDDTISLTISSTGGNTEHVECSARGTCNTENGNCVCTEGYFGEACQTQTVTT